MDALNFKYAEQLDVPVELITNLPLYHFIDDWWGTPYHLGGTTRDGVDCSGFSQQLEGTIFHLELPRTSREQYAACHKIPVPELQEGDLVFFGTKKGITHVGVYLMNNKFVHASTSFGVMISDLGEEYWAQRFRGGGRMPG
ncbi:C40 family peptidase [Dinghuibacter silviterrae]|uniref:C40 family peptidase n=1 Tax=Dinghuibacter silviterrae TaxID=1539049 RepID=UPI0013C2E8CE|nr:NlpC/P60 family protein [Dinghuibacter silviterrae]